MEWIVWLGAALSAIGLAGILWSIWAVARARKANLDDAQLKARMQQILPINVGALMLSVLGLGAVTVGMILA